MFDYWDCCENDIVSPLASFFNNKHCFLREGKIYIPLSDGVASPWIHAKVHTATNCNRYQMIYHPLYGFIPQKCFDCWKVVQKPRNIDELFQIYEYQKEMRIPSKCGIETRQHVFGNYGAYWYNRSYEAGLDRLDVVRKDFPDVPAILKRGCTEFEMSHGPSDQWVKHSRFIKLEEQLEEILVDVWKNDGTDPKKLDERGYPWFLNNNIKRRWVEFAYERGDPMYRLYTRGQPIIPAVVEYEKEFENGCQVNKVIK